VAGRRAYTDAEVEAAVQALTDPEQLKEAQRVVAQNAPTLQRILNTALSQAEWFDSAHQEQVLQAAGKADIEERLRAVQTLIAEEIRVTMMIGAAVGFELAHQLIDKEDS
jgi:copper homeostasis protein CutC